MTCPALFIWLQNDQTDIFALRELIFQTNHRHIATFSHHIFKIARAMAPRGGIELVGFLAKLRGTGDIALVQRLDVQFHLQPQQEVFNTGRGAALRPAGRRGDRRVPGRTLRGRADPVR